MTRLLSRLGIAGFGIGAVFGLGLIVWLSWVGIVMLRSGSTISVNRGTK